MLAGIIGEHSAIGTLIALAQDIAPAPGRRNLAWSSASRSNGRASARGDRPAARAAAGLGSEPGLDRCGSAAFNLDRIKHSEDQRHTAMASLPDPSSPHEA